VSPSTTGAQHQRRDSSGKSVDPSQDKKSSEEEKKSSTAKSDKESSKKSSSKEDSDAEKDKKYSKKSSKKNSKKITRKCQHTIFLVFAIDVQILIMILAVCGHGNELAKTKPKEERIGLWSNHSKRDPDLTLGMIALITANIASVALLITLFMGTRTSNTPKKMFIAIFICAIVQYLTLLTAVWYLGWVLRKDFQIVGWSYILVVLAFLFAHFALSYPFAPACFNAAWYEVNAGKHRSTKRSKKKTEKKSSKKTTEKKSSKKTTEKKSTKKTTEKKSTKKTTEKESAKKTKTTEKQKSSKVDSDSPPHEYEKEPAETYRSASVDSAFDNASQDDASTVVTNTTLHSSFDSTGSKVEVNR